jgi:hypothetical protein
VKCRSTGNGFFDLALAVADLRSAKKLEILIRLIKSADVQKSLSVAAYIVVTHARF